MKVRAVYQGNKVFETVQEAGHAPVIFVVKDDRDPIIENINPGDTRLIEHDTIKPLPERLGGFVYAPKPIGN